jgi:Large polyvalent protein associated domain 23
MDTEGYRRSENVEPPSALDPYWALLLNPLRSQWLDPQGFNVGKRGLATAKIAADFPTFPPVAPTPMSSQLGSEQLPKVPTPADILAGYGGPYEPYPDPGGGAPVTMADVLAGAVERLSAPQRIAKNVVGGAYEDFLDLTKRNIAASGRQEVDPGALFRQTLDIATAGTPVAVRGAAGIFGGKLGAQRLAEAGQPEKLEKLAVAETMLAKGATREEIRDATGWHQNQIGQWQFEIPDYAAGFRPQAEQLLPELGEPRITRSSTGEMTHYTAAPVTKPGQQAFAEHAFAHPDLYAAYPELRQILMRFEDPFAGAGMGDTMLTVGGMDPINRELFLNPVAFEPTLARAMGRPPGQAGMRSTTLHELQHQVQQLEGFPRGGGPRFPEVQKAADAEIRNNIRGWETELAAIHGRRDAYIREQQIAGRDGSVQDFAAEYFKNNPTEVTASANATTNIYNANRGIGREALLVKHYKRLAGEVESRNVQYRADIPEEQLRELPPWETQEVPYGEQLIRMGDPALGMQAELPSFPARMQAGKDVEFARAQRGGATGNYGLPIGGYRTPEAPKGSFERLAAEQRAGFKSDRERIIDEYRTATGQPPRGVSEPLLAPGETAEDVGKYFNLEFMPGESAGPIGGVGMPYLGGKAPLFDYRRLSDVPNVPQFNLPRFVPPEGVPEATQALAAPRNIARVNRAVEAGEALGGREWYNTEQLRQGFISELGEAQGNAAYRQFLEFVAANSPRTRVPENIRNASYFYGAAQRGEPLPETYLSGGYWRMRPQTQAPSPYGIMPIHVQNMAEILQGVGLPPLTRPKPASFVENLYGNQLPVTIDTHNMRLLTRGAEDVPAANQYGFLERLQQEQAARMGMTPAQYQASAWLGAGKETGLASPVEPFLRTLEDRIALTAQARGISKEQALREFIRAQRPLL